MDALSKVKQRNRLRAQLESGLDVAYHLPDIKLCLVEAREVGGSDERIMWEYFRRVVASMLDAIEGEEITERDDRFAIVAALTPDERTELDRLASPEPAPESEPQDWDEAGATNEQEWLAAGRDAVAAPMEVARTR